KKEHFSIVFPDDIKEPATVEEQKKQDAEKKVDDN
ncbi:hypothetical protein, partial [Listeria monocytogenes]